MRRGFSAKRSRDEFGLPWLHIADPLAARRAGEFGRMLRQPLPSVVNPHPHDCLFCELVHGLNELKWHTLDLLDQALGALLAQRERFAQHSRRRPVAAERTFRPKTVPEALKH